MRTFFDNAYATCSYIYIWLANDCTVIPAETDDEAGEEDCSGKKVTYQSDTVALLRSMRPRITGNGEERSRRALSDVLTQLHTRSACDVGEARGASFLYSVGKTCD